MTKVFLAINPPTGNYIRDDRCQVPAADIVSALRAPIDLVYYATIAEQQGFHAIIRDYPAQGLTMQNFIDDLNRYKPDYLLANCTTPTMRDDLTCMVAVKQKLPNCLTIIKGAEVSVRALDIMNDNPQLDIAIVSEAEAVLTELFAGKAVEQINGLIYRFGENVQSTPARQPIQDLDYLPIPNRNLINNRLYIRPDTGQMQTTILASRGCPNNCMFCLVDQVSGEKICQRSPISLVDEMQVCQREHGISNFYFRADTFTFKRDWVLQLCHEILGREINVEWVCNAMIRTLDDELLRYMKKAGCWMIGLGIESGDEDIRKKIGKPFSFKQAQTAILLCKKHHIKTYGFYVLGLPWDTETSIKKTIQFAKKLNTDFVEFHTAYPFPGTELNLLAQTYNLFATDDLHGKHVMHAPLHTFNVSADRVKQLRDRAVKSYYIRPHYIINTLRGLSSLTTLKNYIKSGLKLLWS